MNAGVEIGRARRSRARLPNLVLPQPEVALVVTTYEKPWHLQRALASIAIQEGVEGRMELVVTDDGSTDDTPQIVGRFARGVPFPVSFTTHAHQAFQVARCRNEGVAASKAPYLLFLDGDCVLEPGHVAEHLRRRRPGYALGVHYCRLDEATTSRFDDEVIRSREYLRWIPRRELRARLKRDLKDRFYQLIRHPSKPKLLGSNIGMWRRDYERVNGYDENYQGWGCEDDDLRLRLRRAGVRTASILRWTRTYHLWHPPASTSPDRWRDGANVPYFSRRCRFTRCMNGLVKRAARDLAVGVVGTTARPQAAASLLKSRRIVTAAEPPEVELLFLPGRGRFSGRADCNVLVLLEETSRARRMARKAHLVLADRPYAGLPAESCFKLSEFDRALESLG